MSDVERQRIGCDRCHQQLPTYRFEHFGDSTMRLWLCDACTEALLTPYKVLR
jgi:uncharacterized CHY-type Zn-finger protein